MMVTTLSGTRNPLDIPTSALQETQIDRRQRYDLNWAYYRNAMYDADLIEALSGKAARAGLKNSTPRSRRCTTSAPLPSTSTRAVLAPPVVVSAKDAALEEAIVRVWQASQLQTKLGRLLMWGATMATSICASPWRTPPRPRIVVHPPTEFDILVDPHDPDTILRGELSYRFDQGASATPTSTIRTSTPTLDYRTYSPSYPGIRWTCPIAWLCARVRSSCSIWARSMAPAPFRMCCRSSTPSTS